MKNYFLIIALLVTACVQAQDVIQMEKKGGVYKVPCKINGLALKFVFDTGASDVSISLTEALFMYKNDYLQESDFKGTEYYRIANGDIAEGTKVILKTVEIGKQKLYNVEASVVHSLEAPLLFGQSALQRFGKFTIDYSNNTLIIGGSNTTITTTPTAAKPATTQTTTTPSSPKYGIVTDIDGNVYKTVKIGNQTWMAENLKTIRYNNGDKIPNVTDDKEWSNLKNGAWCYYDNDNKYNNTYGKLYNAHAMVDSRNICPKGWHVSTDNDWKTLEMYLGMSKTEANQEKCRNSKYIVDSDGNVSISKEPCDKSERGADNNVASKLKSINFWGDNATYFKNETKQGTNVSGFNSVPSGIRMFDFMFLTLSAYYWAIDNEHYIDNRPILYYRELSYRSRSIIRESGIFNFGMSCRCVKD